MNAARERTKENNEKINQNTYLYNYMKKHIIETKKNHKFIKNI